MTNINFEVQDELHKKFKIYSIRKGKDMRVLLVEYITRAVQNEK